VVHHDDLLWHDIDDGITTTTTRNDDGGDDDAVGATPCLIRSKNPDVTTADWREVYSQSFDFIV
jgi:hypothetical protein